MAAVNPGLVYDAGKADYVSMLCGEGYNTKNLQLVAGDIGSCTSANNRSELDLNNPSFAVSAISGKALSASFSRTITNIGSPTSSYKATIRCPSDPQNQHGTKLIFIQISDEEAIIYAESERGN